VMRAAGLMVKTVGVEFFCYHRDRPGSTTLRDELREQHWSYMDRYQAQMIARGPTFAEDGDTPAGSVHIVDVPGPPPPARSRSTSPATRPACTGTCCCAAGATRWAAPCGTSRAAGTVATGTWCSA